ncbi:glycosyltransferase family 2 protein [Empedobacter falsenii]
MNTPLISVIVPCYNQSIYIDECLQSVLDQTYQNWECIIVNDGSPDNTEEVALRWVEKDTRFIYLKKENGGLSSARNAGIDKAKGEWILPLDCDDKIGNQYLELASAQFDKDYTVIYCEAEFFGDKEGKWELPVHSLEELAIQNTIFCSAFFKKSNWERNEGYDEDLKSGYEDWEFWICLLKNGGIVYKIPEIGFYYRIKEHSMTTNFHKATKIKKNILNHIYSKHINFFLANLELPYQELFINYKKVKNENHILKIMVNSKRFRLLNKFLNYFNL